MKTYTDPCKLAWVPLWCVTLTSSWLFPLSVTCGRFYTQLISFDLHRAAIYSIISLYFHLLLIVLFIMASWWVGLTLLPLDLVALTTEMLVDMVQVRGWSVLVC